MKSACVVCGRPITWQFSLCKHCEVEYGKRVADWPDWLRFLVNHSRRERTADRNYGRMTLDFDSMVEGGPMDEIQFKRWQTIEPYRDERTSTNA